MRKRRLQGWRRKFQRLFTWNVSKKSRTRGDGTQQKASTQATMKELLFRVFAF
jgi:hypothetical protein